MKKIIKLMIASILALVILLSFASCGIFNKIDIKDVRKAMKDLIRKDDDKYAIGDMDNKEEGLEYAFESIFDIKGDIEGMAQLVDDDGNWVLAVEFEYTEDAKAVAKDLEDKMIDVIIEAYVYEDKKYYQEELGMNSAEIADMIEEWKKEAAEDPGELLPDDLAVERQGNIVFCGSEDLIEDLIEAIEDARKSIF